MLGKRELGFTLMEMMIVVAVLAIMAAIAIPNFMSLLPGMRLNGAARQVMGDLMAARMKTVKLNKKTKVFFNGNGYEYEIWDDADNSGAVADNEGDDKERTLQTNYHDVTFSSTGNPIFSPRGTSNAGGTITLTNSSTGEQKKVTVHSFTGRVKIEDV